jgi:general secretion pathway protein B
MSSILKALKKLEEEKIAQQEESRRHLSGEILKPQVERGISAKWLWLVAGVSTFVILLLIVALLRKAPPEQLTTKVNAPVNNVVTPPSPVQGAPLTKSAEGVPPKTPVMPYSAPDQPVKNKMVQTAPMPHNLPRPAEPELPGFKAPEPPRTEPAPAKFVTSPTEAALTLNGIAWNRDSADRLAIINGQPTGVGEIVAGAVVVEILQDRARFTRKGKTFELSIGKSSVKD